MSTAPDNLIQAPGTPESAWRAWDALSALPRFDDGPPGASLVVIAAHPDDEVLGAGGLIARRHDAGGRVRVVLLTDGDASHPGGPVPVAELTRRRLAETHRALARLAGPHHRDEPEPPDSATPVEVRRLGLPDTRVADHEDTLVRRLSELVAGFDLCAAPWAGDLHADHEAAGRTARAASAAAGVPFIEYPVWAWHWALPDDARVPWERAARVDLTPDQRRRKQRAVACFATQIAPLWPGRDDRVILPPEELAHFDRSFEMVLR